MGTWNTTTIDIQNYGSVLHVFSRDELDVKFQKNQVRDVIYKAKYSALVARYVSLGNFTLKDNVIFNIGYVAKDSKWKLPMRFRNTTR